MKINLDILLIAGLTFLFVLIFFNKNIEGIKIYGLILTHLITGFWAYKRGLDS